MKSFDSLCRAAGTAVLMVLLPVAAAWAAPITNILENPGFEAGGGDLASWSTSVGSASYEPDSAMFVSGARSAMGVELFRGSLGRMFQDVTDRVIIGEEYRISGWIKSEGISTTGGGVVLGLNYVDDFGVTPSSGFVKEIGRVEGTTDWTLFDSGLFTLPAMPVGTAALWFLTDFNDSIGTAWFDDVALIGPMVERVPEPGSMGLMAIALVLVTLASYRRRSSR